MLCFFHQLCLLWFLILIKNFNVLITLDFVKLRVRVRVKVKVKVKSQKSKLDPEVGSVMG